MNTLETTATHTQGPWHAGRDHIGDDIEIRHNNKRGRTLAVVPMQARIDSLESCANARLIAAAPDLLDAALEFVRKVEAGEARSKRSYQQFKAAIDKATTIPA